MPVICPSSIGSLSSDEFRKLDYSVMKHAFASQNELGRLADERIYQADLADRLAMAGIATKREVEIQLIHNQFHKSLYIDLLVCEKAIYELKVVQSLNSSHIAQLLSYLHLLDVRRGKLINFRTATVESQYVNAPLTASERRSFTEFDEDFSGDTCFQEMVIGLLRDWGTSLSVSLYQEAIIEFLGGLETVEVMLPITRNGIMLGKQRFHLASPDTAFLVTAMSRDMTAYKSQLSRLIHLSPLNAIHLVNIDRHEVVLTTVRRS